MSHSHRVPLLAAGMIALLAGMAGGLIRIGWSLPALPPRLAGVHGPLMVSGFLGTVIGLERAVALGVAPAYVGPITTGVASLGLIAGISEGAAAGLMTAGSGVLVAGSVAIVGRQPALHTVTMAIGALAWLAGNALWLAGRPLAEVVFPWALFLVLTIAGERLELTRVLALSAARRGAFVVAAALSLAGTVAVVTAPARGGPAFGLGLLALAVWLGTCDVARRTVRQHGLPRFTATCLLSGYAWLAVAAALAFGWDGVGAGLAYDALLHTIFLGFAFTMIFGHAPIIFPAILGKPVPFRGRFYVHLALLHLTLLLRVAGDLLAAPGLRRWGGLTNVLVLLVFLASTVAALIEGQRRRRPLA